MLSAHLWVHPAGCRRWCRGGGACHDASVDSMRSIFRIGCDTSHTHPLIPTPLRPAGCRRWWRRWRRALKWTASAPTGCPCPPSTSATRCLHPKLPYQSRVAFHDPRFLTPTRHAGSISGWTAGLPTSLSCSHASIAAFPWIVLAPLHCPQLTISVWYRCLVPVFGAASETQGGKRSARPAHS